jgi:hypothetical protein
VEFHPEEVAPTDVVLESTEDELEKASNPVLSSDNTHMIENYDSATMILRKMTLAQIPTAVTQTRLELSVAFIANSAARPLTIQIPLGILYY